MKYDSTVQQKDSKISFEKNYLVYTISVVVFTDGHTGAAIN